MITFTFPVYDHFHFPRICSFSLSCVFLITFTFPLYYHFHFPSVCSLSLSSVFMITFTFPVYDHVHYSSVCWVWSIGSGHNCVDAHTWLDLVHPQMEHLGPADSLHRHLQVFTLPSYFPSKMLWEPQECLLPLIVLWVAFALSSCLQKRQQWIHEKILIHGFTSKLLIIPPFPLPLLSLSFWLCQTFRAPTDCLQWFTGSTGTVYSYNHQGGQVVPPKILIRKHNRDFVGGKDNPVLTPAASSPSEQYHLSQRQS